MAIAAPLFIIGKAGLVIAQCKAGVLGRFPALNARPGTDRPTTPVLPSTRSFIAPMLGSTG
jgi:hypothetical protein